MPRSRFTEEKIIRILKESEAGAKTVELCRRHGISRQTFYESYRMDGFRVVVHHCVF